MADWISDFVHYTRHTGSPEIFRKWTAISIIGAALERKVWVWTKGSVLYPNAYIVLVAPPGVGKSEMTWRAGSFVRELKSHHVAHSSVTKAALIDNLKEAGRTVVREMEIPAVVNFNSLYICSNELGVLLPSYDPEFMNTLTDIWDNKAYSEKRRTKDLVIEMKNPQLNMLAACPPGYVMSMLPEGAWDQGFTSRTLFIYSGESIMVDLFDQPPEDDEGRKTLLESLKTIGSIYGKIEWEEEAKSVIRNWLSEGCPPAPDHPRLFAYLPRRIVHVLKLAMIMCISETQALVMKPDHILRAIDYLIEAELNMPDIFKAGGASSHARIIQETWHFLFKAFVKENKRPINQMRLINFVSNHVPAHQVQHVIAVMENSGLIARRLEPEGLAYIPLGKS